MYYYDQYGWLTSQPNPSRSTDVVPPVETQTLKANWTGLDWVLVPYTTPPASPAPIPTYSRTQKQFWQRFLVTEREALQGLLATGTQVQKNKLNAFRDYVIQGGNVELNDDYIIASVNLMETATLIAAGRAAVILDPTK
jgi:hypothetical protein